MKVVNKKTHRPTPQDVYIGRPSILGNPYTHLMNISLGLVRVDTRDQAVEYYEEWLRKCVNLQIKEILGALREIKEDSNLVCWCAPQRCHGDVIMKVWTELQTR